MCVCVCLSFGHSREPCKTTEPIEVHFGLWMQVSPMNRVTRGGVNVSLEEALLWDGGRMSHWRGHLCGSGIMVHGYQDTSYYDALLSVRTSGDAVCGADWVPRRKTTD